MPSFEQLMTFGERFGFPALIAFLVLAFLLICARVIYKNIVLPLFDVFLNTIKNIDQLNNRNTQALETLASTSRDQRDLMDSLLKEEKRHNEEVTSAIKQQGSNIEGLIIKVLEKAGAKDE
jgi:predicted PurR-regulated permease PerM